MSEKGYLQTKKLCVGYQKHIVVDNIEISLEQGEILTLIGPNGAGKSTVLKSIARQLETLGGSIYLDQKELSRLSGQQLSQSMAVVMTQKLRAEKMTCEDVVATGRYPYTGRFGILSSSDWKVIKEAMELVQVTQIKDLDFNKISDGQRQRVMLARAICQEPQILILDEPTSYLDVKYKLEFLSILQEMKHQKKLTVIMSLHELDLAERISDQILCVNGTTPERFGTPQEIFTKGYILKLFGISSGSFDEKTMNAELQSLVESHLFLSSPVTGPGETFTESYSEKTFHLPQAFSLKTTSIIQSQRHSPPKSSPPKASSQSKARR